MILDDIFLFLKSAGMASSHAQFSTSYLGHSARYYDYLRCSGASPRLQSLVRLALTLTNMNKTADKLATQEILARFSETVMQEVFCRLR